MLVSFENFGMVCRIARIDFNYTLDKVMARVKDIFSFNMDSKFADSDTSANFRCNGAKLCDHFK